MDEYVISALKYRPNDFNEVIGQSSITQTLINAINLNQLPPLMKLLKENPDFREKRKAAQKLFLKKNLPEDGLDAGQRIIGFIDRLARGESIR